jgi:hypothetical protein
MIVDVSAFIGPYPYRHIADPSPERLIRDLDRVGIDRAWVGHLPSVIYRDPRPGTAELLRLLERHRDRLDPIPTIHPSLPGWEEDLRQAVLVGAPAVRAYPSHQGLDPAGAEMRALIAAAADARLPVVVTVKLEDLRQRHPLDLAPDLPGAALRRLAREHPESRMLVTHADRSLVEEVHFGLTPAEAARVLWDISWIWGPPEGHLGLLLETVGVARFTLGTGLPLRLPEGAMAKLDLLGLAAADRAALTGGNLQRWRE